MDVISLLEGEYALYRRLFDLSSRQMNAASTGDMSTINRILNEKTEVITKLIETVDKIKGLADIFHENTHRVSSLTELIRALISEIIECEIESQKRLMKVQKGISEQLSQLNRGLQVVRSLPRGVYSPKYISIKL